jgi:hypothetical protein
MIVDETTTNLFLYSRYWWSNYYNAYNHTDAGEITLSWSQYVDWFHFSPDNAQPNYECIPTPGTISIESYTYYSSGITVTADSGS